MLAGTHDTFLSSRGFWCLRQTTPFWDFRAMSLKKMKFWLWDQTASKLVKSTQKREVGIEKDHFRVCWYQPNCRTRCSHWVIGLWLSRSGSFFYFLAGLLLYYLADQGTSALAGVRDTSVSYRGFWRLMFPSRCRPWPANVSVKVKVTLNCLQSWGRLVGSTMSTGFHSACLR